MTPDTRTTENPEPLREAALAVVREWNAGARAGMGFTPMWGAMENLVAALVEAEAAQGAAPLDEPCGPNEQLCDERCFRCGGTYRGRQRR